MVSNPAASRIFEQTLGRSGDPEIAHFPCTGVGAWLSYGIDSRSRMELDRNKLAFLALAAFLLIVAVFLLLRAGKEDETSSALGQSANPRTDVPSRRLAPDPEDGASLSRKSDRPPTNHAPPSVLTTTSGLQYSILRNGNGPQPGPNDRVKVSYIGMLDDGSVFDDSYKRGKPSVFPVNGVIKGWQEGLQLMKVGSKFKLIIPPDLAYGKSNHTTIPSNSTLTFEIELLEIEE